MDEDFDVILGLCDQWSSKEDSHNIIHKLDGQISMLIGNIVANNFSDSNAQKLLCQICVVRFRISGDHCNFEHLSLACETYVVHLTNNVPLLCSLRNKSNWTVTLNILEICFKCLLNGTPRSDEVALKFLKFLLESIEDSGDSYLSEVLLIPIDIVLKACSFKAIQTNFENSRTKQFLDSRRFHFMLSDLVVKSECEALPSYIIFNIIPKLMKVAKTKTILDLLYKKVIGPDSHILLTNRVFVLCGLAEFFVSKDTNNFLVVNSMDYWKIIQNSLISVDPLVRKRGLYLLKRSVDVIKVLNLQINLELFSWNCLESSHLEIWEQFFILYETLEEKQSHLVIPVAQTTLRDSNYFKDLNFSWALIVFARLISHDSAQVAKLGIISMLQITLDPYLSCLFSFETVVQILLNNLNNMLLFSNTTRNSEWPKINVVLKEWFCTITSHIENEKFFSILITAMADIQWSTIPLLHILYTMSAIQEKDIFDHSQLEILCKFMKDVVTTQNVFIRGAIQCMVLKIITKNSKKDLGILSVANILSVFKSKESFLRGLETWDSVTEWLQTLKKNNIKGHSLVAELLETKSNLTSLAKARCLVLLFDSNVVACNNTLEETIKKYFSVLKGTAVRPYASTEESDKCIEIIFYILHESKSPSSSLCYSDNPLIGLFINFINEIIPYISKRLYEVGLEDFESVKLYGNTLSTLSESKIVSLDSDLFEAAERIIFNPNVHPVQQFLALKIILCFIKSTVSETRDTYKFPEFEGKEMTRLFYSTAVKNGLFTKSLLKSASDSEMTRNHQVQWGHLVSQYTETLWSVLHQSIILRWINERDILNSFPDNMLSVAVSAMECGGREALIPVLGVMKLVLSESCRNVAQMQNFFRFTWTSCFELRKVSSFWPAIQNWVEVVFSKHVVRHRELQPTIVKFAEELLRQGEAIGGLSNVLLNHLKSTLTDAELVKPLVGVLVSALVFGPVPRKDQKIENDTCDLIRSLGSACAVNDLMPQSWSHSSGQVRVAALATLLSAARGEGGEELVLDIVRRLLDAEKQLSAKRQRYHGDSTHHRIKHRILQALMVFESVLAKSSSPMAKSCVLELVKWSSGSLQGDSQQPSVRYQLEWLLVRSLLHCPQLLPSFWTISGQASEDRTGSVCSFICVAYHLAVCLRDEAFTERCVTEILPWCMAQHFNVRLYAQVVLQKMWDLSESVAAKYETVRNSLTKSLSQGNAVRNADKMKHDFYFCGFHALNHFSLETIFYELPRLANIARDEWVPPELLREIFPSTECAGVPLCNPDTFLRQSCAASWVVKASGELETDVEVGVMQKKFVPWRSMFPELEAAVESDDATRRTHLVVVASLIDKLPNLGGLARSCEVFSANSLVVASLEHTRDKVFASLSMGAEKHINIVEVKPHNLPLYLGEMRLAGYSLVGAEQTAASVSLSTFKFPRKCVLVLGNEKEGITVNLLPLLDTCVEVPQLGVVRSLNVHVTGALFIWEYTRQFLAAQ